MSKLTVKTYEYKPFVHLPVPANVVGEELEKIAKKHRGSYTPAHVVQAAKPVTSPLHDCFEWNNKKAADKYRLQQAGYIIRSVVVRYEDSAGEQCEPVRAWVSTAVTAQDKQDSSPKYISLPDNPQHALLVALEELRYFREKYRHLQAFADVIAEIERVERRLKGNKKKRRSP